MSRNTKFKKLLEPCQVRNIRLKNRIVCPAHSRYFAVNDVYVGKTTVASYEALAAGGVGLIVMELASIDYPLGHKLGHHLITDDKFVPGYKELTQAIHKHDCPVFLQLSHPGPEQPAMRDFGIQPLSASALSAHESPEPLCEPAREPTIAEIQDIVEKFAKGAERAQKAGFNGVEVHGAHTKLVNSFLSLAWNRRQDIYGCQDYKSRARFGVEIIRLIKDRVGKDFPVGIRINGREWGHPKGITPEDSQEFARLFEEAGADYISVSASGFRQYNFALYPDQLLYPEPAKEMVPVVKRLKKPGAFVPFAEAVKQAVSVPVVAVGRLDPELGEWILRNDKADLIGMVRRLIADPQLPNKIASGRENEVAPCTACSECGGQLRERKPVRCRINAALGRESEYVIEPASKKKRVVIIGGGPAGMEAGRVAALRGHEVALYEKNYKLGGALPIAALVKGNEIEDIPALARYLSTQMDRLGVRVTLGKELNLAQIDNLKPDVVIVATGGMPNLPEIPGINGGNVITNADLHRKVKGFLRFLSPGFLRWLTRFWMPVGKSVVILGGSIHGCQLAEFLVKRGRKVTVVEMSDKLGIGIPAGNRERLLSWLGEKGTAMLTEAKFEEITSEGLVITAKAGQRQIIKADNVLIALPLKPNTELFQALKGRVPEVYLIGDSAQPRKIIDSINDGMNVGRAI